ncbi:hypothetical protein EX30DRAFT_336366 [Ascodesmis nigricans]|uniref:FAD dependent oxidoreductase domain-containing protein n=1 Tax=Ascodesmis nigricans TaxID=341454 RepID=A0A4S2MNB8_9PEZI|nr:hypothetical protein EX30DRAFT_336366 [Ascodesmis nigricans]
MNISLLLQLANQHHSAGVIGLQTALHLVSHLNPTPNITILASSLPNTPISAENLNYTSPRAGAHWRSQGAHDAALDAPTYTHWRSLLAPIAPATGITKYGLAYIDSQYIWYKHTNETVDARGRGIWWKPLVDDFCVIPRWELPKDAVFGVRFKAFGINPVTYMKYLLSEVKRRAMEKGAREVNVIQKHVEGLCDAVKTVERETGETVDVLVNCAGMGARWLKGVEDEEVYPVKGQTVLVKGECKVNRFVDTGKGWVDAVIRRPGVGTILGVSKVEDDWSEDVEDDLTEKILARCKTLAPELLNDKGEFDVIEVCIGRRPTRPSGVRIDAEIISLAGKERIICHHYGHSGGG